MFRIGEFSKMGKTTVKTLRFYNEIGLLKPEAVDPFTDYRLYTTNQLIKLHKIVSLRQAGLSIDEIKQILSGSDAQSILEKRKTEILATINEGTDQLSRIEFILQEEEKESIMSYDAVIKEIPECTVYSKRFTAPNYDAYFELVPKIGACVTEQYPNLKCAVPAYCFITYLDGEYRENDFNVELCEAVDALCPDFEDIKFKKMDSVTVVSVLHKGDYPSISQAYAFVFKWIEENGYSPAGYPRESYIDGIWNKDNKEDWLTELQVPVASNSYPV